MKYFKSWQEIEDFEDGPTVAEKKLKSALEDGRICKRGPPDKIPAEPNNWSKLDGARHIRADVLRFLLVHAEKGGVQPHELGLQLDGAYISGLLDLDFCKIPLRASLRGCRFEYAIYAESSDWAFDLRLAHSAAPSLNGAGFEIGGQLDCEGAEFHATKGFALNLQSAEIKESLFLRNAKITGKAHLNSLQLGGQLACNSAEFNASEGLALNLQASKVKGHIFLRNAKITGMAYLSGLQLGGQLGCDGAEFYAPKGLALDLQGAVIKGGLFLREIKSFTEILDLTAAKTSTLVDDADSIQLLQHMSLDGFTYDRIIGPTDSKTRLRWLERGDDMNGEFAPQPYKQLAKVLQDMGHESDALKIRIALACKIRRIKRQRLRIVPNGDISVGFLSIWRDIRRLGFWGWHGLSLVLTGHGFKPQRSLFALAVLLFTAYWPAQWAWDEGSFAPNSAPILTSPEWRMLVSDDSIEKTALRWTTPERTDDPETDWPAIPGKDWETFNAFAYAADVVIPIVEFGQTDAWAPSTERGPAGYYLWWLRWVFTIAGWIVTALGAAALTGIIRRE